MKPRNRAIELLEESLQLLRSGGAPVLASYWLGAVPFAGALLLLLHDAALSWGGGLLLRDSLVCAVLFIWLSYWKGRAARVTMTLLMPEPPVKVPWLQSVLFQSIFQTLKLFAMPLAIASIVGWPPVSAFFRSLTLEPVSPERTLGAAMSKAFASATFRYKENLLACLVIAALALVSYFNVLVVFLGIPMIWRTLTGYETEWGRLGSSAIGGLAVVAGVAAWALIDPWIQTYFLLRAFYQDARSDGRDLLREVARLSAVPVILLLFMPMVGQAVESPQRRLDQSIQQAAQSNDYGWLRAQPASADKGLLADLLQKADHALTALGHRMNAWLQRLLHEQEVQNGEESPAPPQSSVWRWVLGAFALLICGAIVAQFLRHQKRQGLKSTASSSAGATADVLNEKLLPSDVNQEEWLRLAVEYLEKHDTRLAARAFYLANLSYLGAQSLISLSLTKTNRLYERELVRHARQGQVAVAFAAANRLYERAWYECGS